MSIQSVFYISLKPVGIFKLLFVFCLTYLVHFKSNSQNVDSSKFATVYFIRDKNLTNSSHAMRIKINNSKIVKLKNNSYHKFTFDTSTIKITVMYMHMSSTSNAIQLYPGQTYYFKYFSTRVRYTSIHEVRLLQVSDSVGRNSIRLIDLNKNLKSKSKQKEVFVKVKRNTVAVDRTLSKDSSYIYFMRQNLFYAGGVPFKISISDSFAFLLPNNSMYIHATTATEVDIIGTNTNNNFQNTILHIKLEKGHAYYVYTCLSFENGIGSTPIRLTLIDRDAYESRIQRKGKKAIMQ